MPSGIEMPNAISVSYVVGIVCFRIKRKLLTSCSRTMVGGGRMAGEISPYTATACHAASAAKAVATGSTSAP
jgi:hypothetical protein